MTDKHTYIHTHTQTDKPSAEVKNIMPFGIMTRRYYMLLTVYMFNAFAGGDEGEFLEV